MTKHPSEISKDDRKRIVGRQAFAAISSVEGLELSEESRLRLDELDASGLTAQQKRDAVIQAYLGCKTSR